MTPTEVLKKLEDDIPAGTGLVSALEKFIKFFSETDVDGCPKETNGDMLLFQWGGPYSWDDHFSINLTRQFSFVDATGEYDRMQQLRMDCRYRVADISIEEGNQWLWRDEVESFLQYVLDAPCVKAAKGLQMQSLEFVLDDV
jgi:hypothetical protein